MTIEAAAAAAPAPAPTGVTYGYVRVSTKQQTYDAQVDAIRKACPEVARVFGEKVSGKASAERAALEDCLSHLRAGDTLAVSSVDRLGRSASEVTARVAELRDRGIVCRFLREGIDGSTSGGRLMITVMAGVAELERELMLERQKVARDAAAARGKQTGRPRKLTADQVRTARDLLDAGTHTMEQVLAMFGATRPTMYRRLAELRALEPAA